MSNTPAKKRRKKKGPDKAALQLRAILAGLGLVVVLVAAFVGIRLHRVYDSMGIVPPVILEQPWPENPYGPEDFSWENGFLTCTAGETRLGIDVSEYQQDVDWEAVAQAGVEYVFVRIGYRGYSVGTIQADAMAGRHIQDARAAGLKVGAYFYSQAVSEEEAAQEAAFCVDFLKEHPIDLPVVFDWEYVSASARTGDMDADTLTDATRTFCREIEAAGYEAMFYANASHSRDLLNLEELKDYGFWLAMYSGVMDYPNRVDVWQYTDTGTVPGISGNVDINLFFTYD